MSGSFDSILTAYNLSSSPTQSPVDANGLDSVSASQEKNTEDPREPEDQNTEDINTTSVPNTPAQRSSIVGLETHSIKRPLLASQYIDIQALHKKLKPESKSELQKYAKASAYAILLQIAERGKALDMGQQGWDMAKRVCGFATSRSWGYSAKLREEDEKWEKLVKCCQSRLTQRRSDIKGIIKEATESKKDIVACCNRLATYGRFDSQVNITVQMYACVAFLHFALGQDGSFWKQVDITLQKVRDTHKEPRKITKWFTKVLEDDRKKYGARDTEKIGDASLEQAEINDTMASGSFVNIDVGEVTEENN
ncbi:hypothetical protein SERLA73DRAFT_70126 [Serpula lacrymans var. lacrymans S7.3]|uniref:Uncharacterized protein n=2 Tax=Serpula lacrymans var. lacrymans TaxID=341189 RepID=F8PM00_SERL3|nr:uncharacterized protein SERLADRAFT_405917 [Serpula lacrymans var. lacrymans S7.9]EGO02632.1 hypothetical protein SERLA73DRAFT_70126 [Serpula lacrymans var. lacrymans S7.3]EGO28337.1 hypothetical protein SERLADRAFT_405917 [Serpula lacrymans var. lacrymans S7.9]